ncbi:MAG TPA: penicillin acylase family protein [Candidatus Kapabacteria bacterium]|nr:penicillin acylase family protein [Candidatus Kapabacteria bacterium]
MFFDLNKTLAILLTIIIFIAISITFVIYLIDDKSETELNWHTNKILNEATIHENNYGVGHIQATNDEDLFFAVGYYQAEKRLWQMDFLRRFSTGELSEIFGKEALDIDKFIRCFEIKNISVRNWDSLSGKSQSIIQSFTNGINYYIDTHKNDLPIEFALLEYEPKPWEAWQTIAISKAMTFEFSFGIWIDIINGQIASKLGENYLKYFIPNFSDFKFNEALDKNKINVDSNYIKTLTKMNETFGTLQSGIGSNCWTTGGTTSQGNELILANDPHTAISVPARWLEVHISNDNFNTVGLMIPGIPLPIIGRNDNISWGITSLLIDDFDYHIEKLSKDKRFYYTNDTTKNKLVYIADTIKIKNSEPYLYYIKKTNISAIISESHLSRNLKSYSSGKYYPETAYFNNNALSFQWIGNKISDEILTMYKINRSENFNEFQSAFNTWVSPGLSFHYVGTDKLIKIVPAGEVPIREQSHNPLIPQASYKHRYKWLGYEKLYNTSIISDTKQDGYLLSANNLYVQSTNYITNYQEPDSRFKRINEVLAIEKPNNISRTKYLQMDQKSVYSKELLDVALKVLSTKQSLLNNLEIKALNKLNTWNNTLSSRDVAASIYTLFFSNLLKNTFSDELGNSLMSQYTFLNSISTRKLLEAITKDEEKIFDNVSTKEIENRDYIIFVSFRDAIKEGINFFESKNISTWHYGKLHEITPSHILNRSPELSSVFKFDKFSIGGDNTTILNSGWNYNKKYEASVYPSVRFVCNLQDTVVYMVLPGGISGNPQSVNYKDQYQLWLNGGYISVPISRAINSDFKRKVSFSKD